MFEELDRVELGHLWAALETAAQVTLREIQYLIHCPPVVMEYTVNRDRLDSYLAVLHDNIGTMLDDLVPALMTAA